MHNTIFEHDKMESGISDSCKELVFQRFNGKRSKTSLTRCRSTLYLFITPCLVTTSFSVTVS